MVNCEEMHQLYVVDFTGKATYKLYTISCGTGNKIRILNIFFPAVL
jgi:hypothetical protein